MTGGVVDRGVVSGVVEEIAFLTVDNIVDVVEEMVNIGVYTGIFGQSASNTEWDNTSKDFEISMILDGTTLFVFSQVSFANWKHHVKKVTPQGTFSKNIKETTTVWMTVRDNSAKWLFKCLDLNPFKSLVLSNLSRWILMK